MITDSEYRQAGFVLLEGYRNAAGKRERKFVHPDGDLAGEAALLNIEQAKRDAAARERQRLIESHAIRRRR